MKLLKYMLPSALLALPASAETLILRDNFNAPDSTNLDASDQTGRRTGLLAPDVQVRSSRIQHGIAGSRLNFLKPASGSGRVRFHDLANLAVWHDFATGPAGAAILADGGLRVEFDWLAADNTSANWVSVCAGIDGQSVAEPAIRVNAAGTDFGILFRNNGGTQSFKNATATNGDTFSFPTPALRHVEVTFSCASLADGSPVTARAWVDGVPVTWGGGAETFQTLTWNGNAGALFLEVGNNATGTLVDNLTISSLDGVRLSSGTLKTSATAGTVIGTLLPTIGGVNEGSAFELIAGPGDTDNAKFQIAGDQLQAGAFDFTTLTDGALLSLRVRATGSTSLQVREQILLVAVSADADSDGLLDTWELAKAGNLTDLNGLATGPGPGPGSGDFDGDGLTDLQEYNLRNTYDLDPKAADTDMDGASDSVELNPTAPRVVSNPVVADTDGDGLLDGLEDSSGVFVDAAHPGTSAAAYDTDGDLFPDGYEVQRGSSPLDNASLPALPAGLTAVALTTDEASGISPAKAYTHKFSGGYAANINGVDLPALTATVPVADLTWTANVSATTAASRNEIAALNFNGWDPNLGGISGSGLTDMFGGLTYSSSGAAPGSFQTFTLTNLFPGQTYDLRLYIRPWAKNTGSGRPVSLTFSNGAQSLNAYVLEDRTGVMAGTGNEDTAYYLSFPYKAESTSLTITALVPPTTVAASGSMHIYGLTNEMTGPNLVDTDGDMLPDAWEMAKAGNLTDLTGLATGPGPGAGSGDFDADGLSDLQEYDLRLTYDLNPVAADTDGDTLSDGAELAGAGARPATNPAKADTDGDGLDDGVETNSGVAGGASDTGTDPASFDSDGDLFPDGYELANGGNPLDFATVPALPAGATATVLTTDESSGISPAKIYTHKISGGLEATVNGVFLDPLRPTAGVADFTWTATLPAGTNATFNEISPANLGEWVPDSGGVTGTGLTGMFSNFTYSGDGNQPGSYQTYTLGNLTPGTAYELRVYIRCWSKTLAQGRPHLLTFTNGAEMLTTYVLEDRPGAMLGNGNDDSAYYLSFPYTAAADSVSLTARIPGTTAPASGSFHLYGLTNEVATVSDPGFAIADISLQASPLAVNLTCRTEPGATYAVDYSTEMTAAGQPGGWIQLATGIPSGGATTTYQDTAVVGTAARIFYRFRKVTP